MSGGVRVWCGLDECDSGSVSARSVQRGRVVLVQQLRCWAVRCGGWAGHSRMQWPVSERPVRQHVWSCVATVQWPVCGWQLWWHSGLDELIVLGVVPSGLRVCGGVGERDGDAVSSRSVLIGWCRGVQQLSQWYLWQHQWLVHSELQRRMCCGVLRQRVWLDDGELQWRVSSGVLVCCRNGVANKVCDGSL